MSRGRPRHHGSRRKAYHARQREVRERRQHAPRDQADWLLDTTEVDDEPAADDRLPWVLQLQARATAA